MRATFIIICVLIPFSAGVVNADTINIPADYPTIQEGIDAAVNGDTVLVAPGTYLENIDFIGKAITVKSSDGPEQTFIDGSNASNPDAGSVVTFMSGEVSNSVLEGFTLTNGTGTKYTTPVGQKIIGGGGIFCQEVSPTIANIVFTLNVAQNGGGVFTYKSNPQITNCVFYKNRTQDFDGGAFDNYYGNPTLIDCLFSENKARGYGGALSASAGTTTVIRCVFSDNWADGPGGAVYNLWNELTLINCAIIRNCASWGNGGGISMVGDDSKIIGCLFIENDARDAGGALDIGGDEKCTLNNCTIFKNKAGDKGGGIFISDEVDVDISNSILWGNRASVGSQLNLTYLSTLQIHHSDVYGGLDEVNLEFHSKIYWNAGMIESDPRFADSAKNDFHLTYTSPCRDTGDNTAVTELFDFEGDPRIAWGGTVDMGADEFYTHLYITGDQTPGGSIQGKFVGLPGTSPVRLFIGLGGVRPTPLPTSYGDLWLLPPRVLIPLVPIPATGILAIPTTVPFSPPAPYDISMQGLVGLNSDSLTNLCVLEVR